ncbi:MAG: hypothetical protein Ct9H90mP19_4710 [Gammaproteobacteria bacterium]|nr:MAG: hypothetical protein Ct9H90mP19_4710 [Gammaproteobacteria bacterium]
MSPSSAGSTDMGNISHRVPSIHPLISCAPPEVVFIIQSLQNGRSELGDNLDRWSKIISYDGS